MTLQQLGNGNNDQTPKHRRRRPSVFGISEVALRAWISRDPIGRRDELQRLAERP